MKRLIDCGLISKKSIQGCDAQQQGWGLDAIDATDAAMDCRAAASTTDKPKWYILDRTETRVLPLTLEISAMPAPALRSSRSCRSCSIDHSLPLKLNSPAHTHNSKSAIPLPRMPLNIIAMPVDGNVVSSELNISLKRV